MADSGTAGSRASADLLGREGELAQVRALLEGIGQRGAALVVTGDAGIGKSALLAAARRHRGVQDLEVTGIESESQLSFAGLHQLLRPVLERVDRLPPRQRGSLLAAFGLVDEDTPDLFITALAALELLAEVAQDRPLLVVVEDAHWLDRATADALGFIARRIQSERIVMLFAVRAGHPTPLVGARIPELSLGPLDDPAARSLLDRRSAELPRRVHDQVLSLAAGNPLALEELPATLNRPAEAGSTQVTPLTTRLEHAFAARLTDLPPATRLLLVVAAVGDADSLDEILRAAGLIGGSGPVGADGLEPATEVGLVVVDPPYVRFRHPLVRRAIQQRASAAERRRAHAAFAEVLRDHPDRRVWHLAAATLGPDDAVADQVEAVAARAEARGAATAAVDGYVRSAELSSAPRIRAERRLRAADLAFSTGDPGRVRDLLNGIDPGRLDDPTRARLALLRWATDPPTTEDSDAVSALVRLADERSAAGDVELALRFLDTAALRANMADLDHRIRGSVVASADRLGIDPADPRLLSVLALAAPETNGRVVIERATAAGAADLDAESAAVLGAALNFVGAFDVSGPFLDRAVAGLRDQGRLGRLPLVLTHQAWTAIHMMDWNVAAPAAEEAARLAVELGQPVWRTGSLTAAAMVAGLRGDHATAERQIVESESVARSIGARGSLAGIRLTRGVMALSAGRWDDAYLNLRRQLDPTDPGYHHFQSLWGVGDFAEAAVYSGNVDEARSLLTGIEALAAAAPSNWLRIGLLYARPLLARADDEAEARFDEALRADLSRWPFYEARIRLQYGVWLRRRRRIVASRDPLRSARDAFDVLGVAAWAARARNELRASGEPSDQPAPDARAGLSPQELQIAHLAANGLSNREIAQRLFLSHRTVGSHLYRTFPKLGVTTRGQLPSALRVGAMRDERP